jgi:hypothetical protein
MVRQLTLLCILAASVFSQQRVDSGNLYHRILAVLPMVGTGTWDDPKRPMFVPPPSQMSTDRSGILAFQFQLSDDGKFALVELVTANKAAFSPILTAAVPNVKVFEVGKDSRAAIETEFKKYKVNFTFDSFRPIRVQ